MPEADTIDRVKALLPRLVTSISGAIEVDIASDRSRTIRASVRDVEQIGSFILGVSRTMAIDLKRRERRRERLRDAFVVNAIAESHGEASLDLDRLNTCIGHLSERERIVVLLTFYAERSAREVGDEMHISEGNVRVVRHRALGKLRTCMTASGGVQ